MHRRSYHVPTGDRTTDGSVRGPAVRGPVAERLADRCPADAQRRQRQRIDASIDRLERLHRDEIMRHSVAWCEKAQDWA